MKKLFIVFTVLVLVVIAGIAFFIVTFDAEKYRPLIENKLSEIAGNPVSLKSVDLSWQNGMALDLQGLAVGKEGSAESLLELGRVKALVDPFLLLKGKLQIGSALLIKPRIHAIKTSQGNVIISGIRQGGKKAGAGSAVSFFVNKLEIEQGEVRFSDHERSIPLDLTIKKLDLEIRDVSLTQPLSFQGAAGIFSDSQNIRTSGEILLPIAGRKGELRDFSLETDLDKINAGVLLVSLLGLREIGLQQDSLSGNVLVEIDRLELTDEWLQNAEIKVKLQNGSATVLPQPGDLKRINLEALLSSGHLDLRSISANLAGGSVSGQATVTRLTADPQSSLKLTLRSLNLSQLTAPTQEGEPYLEGVLSMNFKGQASGVSSEQILASLAGSGDLNLQNGVLVNMNLLREVFNKISLVPGLAQKLKERLPEAYLAKFEARDTVLGPIDAPFSARNGFLYFEQLHLAAETFLFSGAGSVRFDGALSMQGVLKIDPDLSMAIIRSVNELQNLAGAQGMLEIPIVIQNIQGRLSIVPDLRYIGSKIFATKAQEWIGDLLGGKKDQSQTQTPDPSSTGTETAQTTSPANSADPSSPSGSSQNSGSLENLIGGFLQNALQKKTQ